MCLEVADVKFRNKSVKQTHDTLMHLSGVERNNAGIDLIIASFKSDVGSLRMAIFPILASAGRLTVVSSKRRFRNRHIMSSCQTLGSLTRELSTSDIDEDSHSIGTR